MLRSALKVFFLLFVVYGSSEVFAEPLFSDADLKKQLETYSDQEKDLIQEDFINISKLAFRGKQPVGKAQPIYVATAGGGGSSKTTILETYVAATPNLVYADADRYLKLSINTYGESLTNYKISQATSYKDLLKEAYDKWRYASTYIGYSVLNEAFSKGYNIAFGTTSSSDMVEGLYKRLKAKNYKIVLLLCSTSKENQEKAIENREKTQCSFQSVAKDIVEKTKLFYQRFPIYFKYADELQFYWVENFSEKPILAASFTKKEGIVVHDSQSFNKFKERYDQDRKGTDLPPLMRLAQGQHS